MNFFEPLNRLIELVYESGWSDFVYDVWNVLDFGMIALFCLFYRRHYGISRKESVLIPAIIYITSLLWIRLIGWAATGFRQFGPNNVVKGYSFFPLFALIPAKIFRKDWKTIMDFTAPCFPLLQFVGHLACHFAGCCYGYPMQGGIWNPVVEDYLFPIQLLESFVALAITVGCVLLAKKQNYRVTGRIYPVFLIAFGGTRFFLEFLRDNEKLFLGISELALWALLMVTVGVVWLAVDSARSRKSAAE